MPLTDELGNLAVKHARLNARRAFDGGRFEAWLSRLAEPQPDLSDADNAANLARFLRLSEAIHTVLGRRQATMLKEPFPSWLMRFLAAAHASRATIITFNYDLIVEHAIEQLQIHSFDRRKPLQWAHALDGVPPVSLSQIIGYPIDREILPTLLLLKLHGSLNWYWDPGDNSGATLSHATLSNLDSDRRLHHPGRAPFIAPPAAAKSAFFDNLIMRDIWQRAAKALRAANEIAFAGYSMPVADLVSTGMITDSISGREVETYVANPAPRAVAATLLGMTGRNPVVSHTVPQFTEGFVDRTSRDLLSLIASKGRSGGADESVAVGWNLGSFAPATQAKRTRFGMELVVGDLADPHPTARTRDGMPGPLTTDRLRQLAQGGGRLEAVFANGARSTLVGVDELRVESGPSTKWQVLLPADRARDLGLQNYRQFAGLDPS